MKFLSLAYFFVVFSWNLEAGCLVRKGEVAVSQLEDPLFLILKAQENCPESVFELKTALKDAGLSTSASLVANRGRHNPQLGSFSFFESVTGTSPLLEHPIGQGEFFFGHFTGERDGKVELDQKPTREKLLIELIVWSVQKGQFHFYELIGNGSGADWFYRGDSHDAFLDNAKLHLQPNPTSPQFGSAMRCSGCHTSGGPILKELAAPHNDWWTKERGLPFTPNQPSTAVSALLKETEDVALFAGSVKKGILLLEESKTFQALKQARSLKEQLRPLFCTTEINLVSALAPHEASDSLLKVPAEFWVGARLAKGRTLNIPKVKYAKLLTDRRYQFPETTRVDADHGWLAPVKGYSDFAQIDSMGKAGLVSEQFIDRVLAVDFKNPLFSSERCALLARVPTTATPGWETEFLAVLPESPTLVSDVTAFLKEVQDSLQSDSGLAKEVDRLEAARRAVLANEISKNPRGQILEPGFRVIFPRRRS